MPVKVNGDWLVRIQKSFFSTKIKLCEDYNASDKAVQTLQSVSSELLGQSACDSQFNRQSEEFVSPSKSSQFVQESIPKPIRKGEFFDSFFWVEGISHHGGHGF